MRVYFFRSRDERSELERPAALRESFVSFIFPFRLLICPGKVLISSEAVIAKYSLQSFFLGNRSNLPAVLEIDRFSRNRLMEPSR